MSIPTNLLATTQADVEGLILSRAQEGPHLDFKRDIPANWDNSARNELLADVTAFANAGGGDLIFGVAENENAEAVAIVPQVVEGIDALVLRLQNFLLDLADPRLPGVQVHPVDVTVETTAGHVVIIRVPQSWASPHRVKVSQHVYVREGRRKRPLDMPELRALVLRTESQAQRVKDFRSDRLAKILIGETPTPIQAGPRLVVHAVPTQAALGLVQLDPIPYARGERQLPAIDGGSASSGSVNFDGAYGVSRSYTGKGPASGYTQLFRQGYFEAVLVIEPRGQNQELFLPGIAYEENVNKFIGRVRGELDRHGILTEVAIFMSLLGADKVIFAGPADWGSGYTSCRFDRASVLLPEVVIPPDISPGKGMRPAYDLMCQSVGLYCSANYGADGEWESPRSR